MQTRGRARTAWRLDVYRTALGLCRAGGFSLARFLAVPADKLRLAVGESLQGAAIPVWVDPGLVHLADEALCDLAASLSRKDGAEAPAAVDDPAGIPGLDLSLLDGRLDPRRVASWMARRGLKLQELLTETMAKAFALVGRVPGGEETALVGLLAVGRELAEAAARAGSSAQAGAALLLERATAKAAEHPSVDAESLSARTGLRAALLQSHLGLARNAAFASAELNTYRTVPAALQAARTVLREKELGPPDDPIDRIAGHLLSDPAAVEKLWIEAAAELVRDALAEAWLCVPLPARLAQILSASFADPALLRESISDHAERDRLAEALSRATPRKPFEAALALLRDLGHARARRRPGDAPPALVPGMTPGRLATDAARGAWLLAADASVVRLVAPLEASLERAPPAAAARDHQRGRRYRFGPGSEPIQRAAAAEVQAQLFVDMKDFTRRTLKVKERGMVHFLRTEFYEPIFAEAARLQDGDEEKLAVSNALGDALAFRGAIGPIVDLGLAIARHLGRVRQRLDEAAPEVMAGGEQSALQEARVEQARLAELCRALEAKGQRRDLLAARAQEREVAASIAGRQERLFGGGLEAGSFITYGAPAEVVEIAHPQLGAWPMAIAERLNEAARGTARSGPVKALRESWEAAAGGLPLAFAVSIGGAASLKLPPAIPEALARDQVEEALRGLAGLFKSLQGELLASRASAALEASPELYNEGTALSAGALDALRAAWADRVRFVDWRVELERLPPALRAQLSFGPEARLDLVLALSAEDGSLQLVFRRAGAVRFKGFDEPTEVVELCDPAGLFTRLLREQAGPVWRAA